MNYPYPSEHMTITQAIADGELSTTELELHDLLNEIMEISDRQRWHLDWNQARQIAGQLGNHFPANRARTFWAVQQAAELLRFRPLPIAPSQSVGVELVYEQ